MERSLHWGPFLGGPFYKGAVAYIGALNLAAELISITKVYTFSSIRDQIIPEGLKCIRSATKKWKVL